MKPLETKTEDQLISISEASKLTGYNRDYIGRLVSRGEIAGQRVGRNWLTTPRALKAFFGGPAEVVAAPVGPVLPKAGPGLLRAVGFALASTLVLVLVYLHTQGGIGVGSLGVVGKALVPAQMGVENRTNTTYTTDRTYAEQGKDNDYDNDNDPAPVTFGSDAGQANDQDLSLRGRPCDRGNLQTTDAQNADCHVAQDLAPRNDTRGMVLGDSVSFGQGSSSWSSSAPAPINFSSLGISEYQLNSIIAQQLTNLASIGLLGSGQGSSSSSPSYNSTTPSAAPVITYIQPAPAQNFNGASLLSATDLSSTRFTTTTANITDTATIKTLSVTENATVGGGLTVTGNITGNVIGTINPSFTLGSIPFQGASNLTQDNSNFFWDNTNKRLGVGTSSPTANVHIKSTGGVGDNNGLMVTNGSASVRLMSNFATLNEVGLYDSNDAGIAVSNVNTSVFKYGAGEIEVHASGGKVLLGVQGGGNVGIGTTAPTAHLMVENASGAATPNVLAYTPGINGLTRYQAKNDTARTVNLDMFGSNYYGISSLANSGGVGTGESPFIVYTDATTGATGGTNPIYFSPGGYNNIKVAFTSGGNVGIGTTTPGYKLELSNGNAYGNVRLVTQGVGYGDPTAAQTVSAGDKILFLNESGAKTALGAGNNNEVWVQSSGALTGAAFRVLNGVSGAAPTERFTVLGNGNVGIGTTSPAALLHVVGSGGVFRMQGTAVAGAAVAYALITDSAGTGIGYIGDSSGSNQVLEFQGSANTALQLGSNNSPVVYIPTGGNVGIGASNPQSKFTVSGNAAIGSGYTGTAAPTDGMIVQGNVGIGTSTPSSLLHMATTRYVDTSALRIISTDSSGNPGTFAGTATGSLRINPAASSGLGEFVVFNDSGVQYQGYNQAGNTQFGQVKFNSSGLGLFTNSVERIRVDTAGNVGIGTTIANNKLEVLGNALFGSNGYSYVSELPTETDTILGYNALVTAANANLKTGPVNASTIHPQAILMGPGQGIRFVTTSSSPGVSTDFAISTYERMRIDTAGNVGIGSTSPAEKLDVTGNGQFTGTYPYVNLKPSGWSGSTFYFQSGVNNIATTTGDYTAYVNPSGKGFSWLQSTTARMIIDTTGNVGIGTTAPGAKLEVSGSAAQNLRITNSGTVGWIDFYEGATVRGYLGFGDNNDILAGATTDSMSLRAQGALHLGTNGTLRATIDTAGNVGIGTATPGDKLEVAGNIKIGSNVIYSADTGTSLNIATATWKSYNGNQTIVDSNGNTTIAVFNNSVATTPTLGSSGTIHVNNVQTQLITGGSGAGTPGQSLLVQGGDSTTAPQYAGGNAGNLILQSGKQTDNTLGNEGARGYIAFKTYTSGNTPTLTERVRVSADGNVGIGTTAPNNKVDIQGGALQISGGGGQSYAGRNNVIVLSRSDLPTSWLSKISYSLSGGSSDTTLNFELANSASTTANVMTLLGNGNVGIGTTAPGAGLHVNGSGVNGNVVLIGDNSNGGYVRFQTNAITNSINYASSELGLYTSQANGFRFYTNTGSDTATPEMTISNAGNVGIGTTAPASIFHVNSASNYDVRFGDSNNMLRFAAAGGINYIQSMVSYTGGSAADLRFTDAGGGNTWMTIKSAGNVGIGTTAPANTLDVVSSATNLPGLRVKGGSSVGTAHANNGQILLGDNSGGVAQGSVAYSWADGYLYIDNTYDSAAANIRFRSRTSGTPVEIMTLTGAGNVGIGTTTATQKLEVNGNILVNKGTSNRTSYLSDNGLFISRTSDGAYQSSITADGSMTFNTRNDYTFNTDTLPRLSIINATGFVGIGEAAPGSRLSVSGGMSVGASYDTTAAPTDGMIVQGNVGIGTTTPTYKLDVNGTANTVGIRVASSTASDIWYYGTGTVTGDANLLQSAISATGSVQANIANSNTTAGDAKANVQVGGASAGDPYYLLTVPGATNWSIGIDNSDSDKLKIGPVATPSTGGQSITIQTDGNIGIGTSSAGQNLVVGGNAIIGRNNTSGISSLFFNSDTNTDSSPHFAKITKNYASTFDFNFYNSTNQTGAPYNFYTDDGSIAPRLSIATSLVTVGSVVNPASLLVSSGGVTIGQVNGTANGILKVFNTSSGAVTTGIALNNQSTSANSNIALTFNAYNEALYASIQGLYSGTTNVGSLAFLTNNGGTNTERMRIDNTGNVGIGTTTPSTTLDVRGAADFLSAVRIGSAVHNTGNTYLVMSHSSPPSSGTPPQYSDKVALISQAAGDWGRSLGLHFAINNTADGSVVSTSDTKMFLSPTGNLGIGTTSPASTLDIVAGAGGAYTARGDIPDLTFRDTTAGDDDWTMYADGDVFTLQQKVGDATWTSRLTVNAAGNIDTVNADLGDGVAGKVITLGRNTNATNTGAGSINFQSKAGTAGYVWQDNAGNLRIHTAAPSNANDTAGTVVGTQTSTRDTKQDIQEYTDYAGALQAVINAPLRTFKYIKEVEGYGSSSPLAKNHIGFIADEVSGDFMQGNSIDQVSVNGLLMASVKALDERIKNQELRIKELEIATSQGLLAMTEQLLGVSSQNNNSNITIITKQLYLSGDSVGQAKILAGATSVRVTFSTPYEEQPIVTLTPNGKVGGEYWVADKDATGFSIVIDRTNRTDTTNTTNTVTDVTFDWHAFASPEAKLTVSDGTNQRITLVVPAPPASQEVVTPELPLTEKVSDEGEVAGESDTQPEPTPEAEANGVVAGNSAPAEESVTP